MEYNVNDYLYFFCGGKSTKKNEGPLRRVV